MADYENEITALIGSLTNPRYATQDAPASAPILFDGVLQNQSVTFVANQLDPHEYGVDVWNKAQAGEYGAIAPWTPFPDEPAISPIPPGWPPPETVPALVGNYFIQCAKQIIISPEMAETMSQATAMVHTSGGHAPGGARGAAFERLAAAFSITVDQLVASLLALEELHFAHMAARSAFKAGDEVKFKAYMADAVAAYNEASSLTIKAPA